MNTRASKKLAIALSALAAPMALAGCGGVPGNAVATVDGEADHEEDRSTTGSTIAAKSGGQQAAQIPKPPDFTACIANKRKTLPKPAKGQPKVTDAQLKTQCKQEYEALRDQVLQLLISFEWIEGEADEHGVKVTDAEVKKQFETQKKASFPKDADFEKFLKDSGQIARGHPAARPARRALQQDPREDHQGQGQGHRRRDQEVLRQEQGSASPSPSAATCSSC